MKIVQMCSRRRAAWVVVAVLAATGAYAFDAPKPSHSPEALLAAMAGFKAAVLARQPVALTPNAEVRENMELTTLEKSAWTNVKAIRSSAVFSDAVTGNVVSRDGVELNDGTPGYLSTRLRVEGGKIAEVELSADLRRANPAYVWNLPEALTAPVPRDERSSRDALDTIARRYFQSLSDHKGIAADFDDARCNRFHSGVQVTNVARNEIEGGSARTCFTSIDGPKPWGPAVEQRFPVIDTDRGVVFGLTLLMYAEQVMYVSEVFKIEAGRIVHIDNIGIVKPGRDHTTGFAGRR